MNHQPRKRFGQNFLVDNNIIQKIVAAISPTESDRLIEIGPGLGALTAPLLSKCPSLTAIELDRDLIERLNTRFASYPDFTVIQHDALKFDFAALANKSPLRIAGNLPYNISTPLIFHLLRYSNQIQDMHFMLQKEVVERLAASPGSKAYGRLSVMVQYRCKVEPLFPVPPTAFNPAPKVESAIVRLRPYVTLPYIAKNEPLFSSLVKLCFQQRRKTLRNSLKNLTSSEDIEDALSLLEIDPKVRPESLALKDFVLLSNKLAGNL